jgi:HSP20 family molecular chaperone IbpA
MSRLDVQKIPATGDRSLPIFAEFDRLADRIRLQAYNLFSRRGTAEGHALDDWLAAEREVCWPAAELAERDAEFVLSVALAGFQPNDITVTATPREILVKAAHKHEQESTGTGDRRFVGRSFEATTSSGEWSCLRRWTSKDFGQLPERPSEDRRTRLSRQRNRPRRSKFPRFLEHARRVCSGGGSESPASRFGP